MIQQLSVGKERSYESYFKTRTSRSFTTKLSQHGMYKDSTLDTASRDKDDHIREKRLRDRRMARIEAEFEAEVEKVEVLQESIFRRQADMAATALRKHSTLCVQSVFRGHLARVRVQKMRSARRICAWLYRIFAGRVRKIVSIMTYRTVSRRACATILRNEMTAWIAATNVQKVFRMLIQYRKFRRRIAIRQAAKAVAAHVLLFAARRALRRLSPTLRTQRAGYRLLQCFSRMKRLKRLRSADNVAIFEQLAASGDSELFEFIKARAIAMESRDSSSSSSIYAIINTPRNHFTVKPKFAGAFGNRRGQIVIKSPEKRSPW
jgi:hypothetical protein